MNNRFALATIVFIVIATIAFAVFLLNLDSDSNDDKPEGAASTQRHEEEDNKPEDAAAETANALATRQLAATHTLSPSQAQDATNALAATYAQATIRAFEGASVDENGTPLPIQTRRIAFRIDQLHSIEAQEDRIVTVDGYGDEVYIIYVLSERDADGNVLQAQVESWGVTRMEAGDIIAGGEFSPIILTVNAQSNIEVSVSIMESEDISRADRFINTLKEDIDNVGADILDLLVPTESLGVSDLLSVLDLGVEVLEFFGEDDTLGEFTELFTVDMLDAADPTISRQETLERDRLLEKFEYRLDYSLQVN